LNSGCTVKFGISPRGRYLSVGSWVTLLTGQVMNFSKHKKKTLFSVSYEVFMVFWVVTACRLITEFNPEDGGIRFFQNIGIYMQNYMVL
jgi:hypothetical protein